MIRYIFFRPCVCSLFSRSILKLVFNPSVLMANNAWNSLYTIYIFSLFSSTRTLLLISWDNLSFIAAQNSFEGFGRGGGRWWTEESGEKRGFKGNKIVGFCGREVLKNRDRINQVLRRAICLKSVHEQYCLNEIIDKLMRFVPWSLPYLITLFQFVLLLTGQELWDIL